MTLCEECEKRLSKSDSKKGVCSACRRAKADGNTLDAWTKIILRTEEAHKP